MPLLMIPAGSRAQRTATSPIMANRARIVTPEVAGFLAGFAVVTSSQPAVGTEDKLARSASAVHAYRKTTLVPTNHFARRRRKAKRRLATLNRKMEKRSISQNSADRRSDHADRDRVHPIRMIMAK